MDKLMNLDTGVIVLFGFVFICIAYLLGRYSAKSALKNSRGIKKTSENGDLADEIEEKIRMSSESIRNEILSASKKESQELLKKTQDALLREKEKLVEDLRKEALNISVSATEKLLKQSIDKKIQEKFLHDFLDDLEKYSKEIH